MGSFLLENGAGGAMTRKFRMDPRKGLAFVRQSVSNHPEWVSF